MQSCERYSNRARKNEKYVLREDEDVESFRSDPLQLLKCAVETQNVKFEPQIWLNV